MPAKRKPRVSKAAPTPAVVYLWAFGLAMVGYVAARIALDAFPHPVHWLGGVAGAAIGVPLGWLWYRRRGDVF